ncbi:MAG: hypothetical protein CMO55_13560 [Verrucomicrobiales bacterium]|nr:hypothetical protein [Verrucomicrobiales bacterium]
MNWFLRLFLFSAIAVCFSPVRGADLTPEQIESLKAKLKSLKENLDNHVSTRNSGAGDAFMNAASDPRAAVDLYINCYKLVNFDREGRSESDFRAWKDDQSDRFRDPQFVESLQHQLRYLALSCDAAEVESVDKVFSSLMSYVDGLSRMEELPGPMLTQSVAGSIFAKAYYLEKLLGKNENWESVPFNIGGIYDRTILPHLRSENPSALMSAWDKRIEQQSRLAMLVEQKKEEQLRGMDRDQARRARNAQNNQRGVLGTLDSDDFANRTLPLLKWGKLKDMFYHVDQVNGAKAMLDFVEANLTTELGEDLYSDFANVISSATKEDDNTSGEVEGASN